MQAISSITMYTDNEGQQETVTWGGKKTRQGKETWSVYVFVKNIVIFLLRKDKTIIVKQNILADIQMSDKHGPGFWLLNVRES